MGYCSLQNKSSPWPAGLGIVCGKGSPYFRCLSKPFFEGDGQKESNGIKCSGILLQNLSSQKGVPMKITAAFSLLLALVIPFAVYSENSDNPYGAAAYHWLGHCRVDICSGDILAMGPKPSAADTCKCWSCPWDQRIYCNTPDSYPDCKWLLFSCKGPRPEECCDE